jgi:putative glutamine amidotransferase
VKPILLTARDEGKARPYVEALAATGISADGIRVIDEAESPAGLTALATSAAGLLLSGGPDVAPERYGEARLNDCIRVRERRDQVEWELLRGAEAAAVPVFAVCRGMQVANVYLGGSLYQDLPQQVGGTVAHCIDEPLDHLAHQVRVLTPKLPLGSTLGPGPAVNSRHHQAIKRLGERLVAVAESPDGVPEAAQLPPDGWWLWAVQWHPENLLSLPEQFRLWQAFTAAARQRADGDGALG